MEKPLEQEQGWKTLTVPEMIQWDKPGTLITGKLLSVAKIDVRGKGVLQYILATGIKDQKLKCLATYDLAQKLGNEHRGMLVRIKYLGEDESVKRNGNAMKVFDVHVKLDPDAPQHLAGGPITDEDIPF